MKSKVNLKRKKVAPPTQGIPKSSQQFKLIKIRSDLYFRLNELRERRKGRCTFNRVIAELLSHYEREGNKSGA